MFRFASVPEQLWAGSFLRWVLAVVQDMNIEALTSKSSRMAQSKGLLWRGRNYRSLSVTSENTEIGWQQKAWLVVEVNGIRESEDRQPALHTPLLLFSTS